MKTLGPDARPPTRWRGLWPTDTPWWHTALYLLFVLGDYTAAFGQGGRETWQDVLMGMLLPVVVLGILRRTTWPLVLPIVALLPVALAGSSMLPIAVLSLVLRRRDWLTVVLLVAGAASLASPFADAYTDLASGDDPVRVAEGAWLLELGASVAAQVVVPALLGGYLAVRRRLALEQTARRRLADDARHAREREAVLAERRRIAAEMHDAVGHQLALISLQAGALEVNPAAGPEVVERHAAAVRTAATSAARDLRTILDVLGSDDAAPAAHEPQPGLAEVPTLLDRTRSAGVQVRAELDLGPVDRVGASTGRAAYRIVQESVTNALRHAHGRPITVSVTVSPDDGIAIAVTNPVRPDGEAERAGQAADGRVGLGLGGLAERARSVGGMLSASPERGPVGQELWAVRAHLPWSEGER